MTVIFIFHLPSTTLLSLCIWELWYATKPCSSRFERQDQLRNEQWSPCQYEVHVRYNCEHGHYTRKNKGKKKENPTCLAVGKPYIMRNHQSDFRDKMFSLGEVKVQGHKLTKVWTNGFGLDEWLWLGWMDATRKTNRREWVLRVRQAVLLFLQKVSWGTATWSYQWLCGIHIYVPAYLIYFSHNKRRNTAATLKV